MSVLSEAPHWKLFALDPNYSNIPRAETLKIIYYIYLSFNRFFKTHCYLTTVRLSAITTSIRQYGVKEAARHKMHTTACTHLCSRVTVDSLAKRLSSHCRIGHPLSRSFSSLAPFAGTHAVATSTVCCVSR